MDIAVHTTLLGSCPDLEHQFVRLATPPPAGTDGRLPHPVGSAEVVASAIAASSPPSAFPGRPYLPGVFRSPVRRSGRSVSFNSPPPWVEDYLQIERVEPGALWFEGGVGPLKVPTQASALAEEGWSVHVGARPGAWSMALSRGRQRLPVTGVVDVPPFCHGSRGSPPPQPRKRPSGALPRSVPALGRPLNRHLRVG
jgi:hypothetical protein